MTRYRFREHELDDATGELTGPGGVRRLEPQPARVLSLLLAARGELVSREELQRRIWGDVHVGRDEGLAYCIRRIRAALDDEAAAPRFVETLPRRGYRFLAPVEVLPAAAPRSEAAAGGTRRPVSPPARGGAAIPARWVGVAALGLLALIAVGAAALRPLWPPSPPASPAPSAPPPAAREQHAPAQPPPEQPAPEQAAPEPPPAGPLRLAILPLAPQEGPPTPLDRELGRALVAALTTRGTGRLEVVGPATTAPIDPRGRSQPELGSELGVDYLLSGGTSPDGEIVFLQLIRSSDGAHLWARRLPTGAPGEIAREAAGEILGRLPER